MVGLVEPLGMMGSEPGFTDTINALVNRVV